MIYAYIFSHYKMTRINKNTDFLGHLRALSFIPEVQETTNSVANSEFDVWKSFVFLTRGRLQFLGLKTWRRLRFSQVTETAEFHR